MNQNALQIYERWLQSEIIDSQSKQELLKLRAHPEKIVELFGSELAFGTGGLRGIMGIGLNRMNIYTLRKTTQGLANYLIENQKSDELKVVIAYDTRMYSREFAEEAALVLAANGIQALVFPEPRPTPLLSFAVRELKCAAGVVITASHNPPEYNGYKVYGPDGAQIAAHFLDNLTLAIKQVDILHTVKTIKKETAKTKGLLQILTSEIDQKYLNKVRNLSQAKPKKKLKVVFTPLHGTGMSFIPTLLKESGYLDLFVVEEQAQPDPYFSTVKIPNPESISSFKLAFKLACEKKANLIIATDPDCDRLGCAIRVKDEYHFLTGNQIGALILEYFLSQLKLKNKLPNNGVLIKTVVTNDLGKKIAATYGIETLETLTGFKYIGEKIRNFEKTGKYTFLFGYEESHGYLVDTFTRDKDANIAALLLTELTAYYWEKGLNLLEVLEKLYQEHGYFAEDLISMEVQNQKMVSEIMSILKQEVPKAASLQAVEKRDFELGKRYNLITNEISELDFPQSKVLAYHYDDHSWFAFRPSGTEPKVKFYFSAIGKNQKEAEKKLENLKKTVLELIKG